MCATLSAYKHCKQKLPREARVYLAYMSITEGHQGRNWSRDGTEMLLPGLLSLKACSACSSTQQWYCPQLLPHQSVINKTCHNLLAGQSDGNISSVKCPFSRHPELVVLIGNSAAYLWMLFALGFEMGGLTKPPRLTLNSFCSPDRPLLCDHSATA